MSIRLKKHKNMSMKTKLHAINLPSHIYIPLISQNDTNVTLLVKKGDYVFKGSVVARRKGNFRIPIHSTVSGTVIGIEEKYIYNGSKVRCVVVENDYKEKYEISKGVKRNLGKFTKREFVELLKETGVVGLGGSGFPTYVKYNGPEKISTLIVNALESEPYATSDFSVVKENCEEILETIDAIMEINHINKVIIAVKKSNEEGIKILNNFIGTYLGIKIVEVPDSYALGYERELVKYLLGIEYKYHPIEASVVVNNISTIYSIYQALKYQQPILERVITFTGDMIKKPQNVIVKYGTLASEVIEAIGGYKKENKIKFIAGGPMMGITLPTDEIVITSNIVSFVALKYQDDKEKADCCINCGMCVQNCPARLSPVLIMENLTNEKKLKKLEPDRCINCGLCDYVCPAGISLRKCVKEAKVKVGNEK